MGFESRPEAEPELPVPEQVPEQADVEGDVLEHEAQAAEVIKEGQIERAGLCKRMLTSEITSAGLELVPFVGSGKMLVESIAGGTLTGRELTGKARIIHAAVGAGMLALDFTGVGEAADVAVVAGKSTALIGRLGALLAKKGATKAAAVFATTAEVMGHNPELVKAAEAWAVQKIKEYRAQHA